MKYHQEYYISSVTEILIKNNELISTLRIEFRRNIY